MTLPLPTLEERIKEHKAWIKMMKELGATIAYYDTRTGEIITDETEEIKKEIEK